MDFITKIFEFDLGKIVPDMAEVLEKTLFLVKLSVLVGPILLLVLGLMYLLIPPKEANHKLGFRTYFGMGSVEAWRFTQKLAGIVFGALGLILLIVAVIVMMSFEGKDHFQMTVSAMICLLWQAGLALAARLAVSIVAAVFFDKDGYRRKQ